MVGLAEAVRRAAPDLEADRITVVCDGRGEDETSGGVEVVWAGGGSDAADDRIVELLRDAGTAAADARVVTADRGLQARVLELAAEVASPGELRRRLDAYDNG